MQFVTRISNLVRGMLAQWLGRREHRNPGAVYEAAIQERLEQYNTLRQAAAGVLYMRSKLSKELQDRSGELARLRRQLDVAVERDDDAVALTLITRCRTLESEVQRVTGELTELTAEADAAKKNLIGFQNEIEHLRDEKVRMLARLANAKARLRLHETLGTLSPDADIRALEAVREHINRLVAEVQVTRDLGDTDLAQRIDKIRETEADVSARAHLQELKRARQRVLLPLLIPRRATAAGDC
jgi:phage shock protein A